MKTIRPYIADNLKCQLTGAIYASSNPHDLSEDMVEVLTADGVLICAGWSPMDAAYLVVATQGLHHIRTPFVTSDPEIAARTVERWAAQFVTRHTAFESDSETQRVVVGPATISGVFSSAAA